MIDEHDAERDGTGGQRAAGEPEPSEAPSAGELVTADEVELAEDAVLGEAERALLRWALRQRELAPGEPLLPTRNEPLQPAETPTPTARAAPTPPVPGPRPEVAPVPAPKPTPMRLWPEPAPKAEPAPTPASSPESAPRAAPVPTPASSPEAAPARPPASRAEAAPRQAEDRHPSPPKQFHGSAEEAISALVAAGGPDPRDFASPRLDRRAKMVIALALVVLFLVSVLGGFVGYRVTHRAAGGGSEPVGRPAGIHAGAAAPAEAGV
jgi:outer membrane biosynthesis protein TonB